MRAGASPSRLTYGRGEEVTLRVYGRGALVEPPSRLIYGRAEDVPEEVRGAFRSYERGALAAPGALDLANAGRFANGLPPAGEFLRGIYAMCMILTYISKNTKLLHNCVNLIREIKLQYKGE